MIERLSVQQGLILGGLKENKMTIVELVTQLEKYDPQTKVVLETTNNAPIIQLSKNELNEDIILILD